MMVEVIDNTEIVSRKNQLNEKQIQPESFAKSQPLSLKGNEQRPIHQCQQASLQLQMTSLAPTQQIALL